MHIEIDTATLSYIQPHFTTPKLGSKEEYLEWVEGWKWQYKNLSEALRALRVGLSEPHEVEVSHSKYGTIHRSKASHYQYMQHQYRADARAMLEARRLGKELSWERKMRG